MAKLLISLPMATAVSSLFSIFKTPSKPDMPNLSMFSGFIIGFEDFEDDEFELFLLSLVDLWLLLVEDPVDGTSVCKLALLLEPAEFDFTSDPFLEIDWDALLPTILACSVDGVLLLGKAGKSSASLPFRALLLDVEVPINPGGPFNSVLLEELPFTVAEPPLCR